MKWKEDGEAVEALEKTRQDLIREKSREFISSHSIRKLPVGLAKLRPDRSWERIEAHRFTVIRGLTDRKAFSCWSPTEGKFITFTSPGMEREELRWCLAREIGKIYLGHLDENRYRGMDRERYQELEREAEFFAFNLLAPRYILEENRALTEKKINFLAGIPAPVARRYSRQLRLTGEAEEGAREEDKEFFSRQFRDDLRPLRYCGDPRDVLENFRACSPGYCGCYTYESGRKICPECGGRLVLISQGWLERLFRVDDEVGSREFLILRDCCEEERAERKPEGRG